jgi:hypothetical protein
MHHPLTSTTSIVPTTYPVLVQSLITMPSDQDFAHTLIEIDVHRSRFRPHRDRRPTIMILTLFANIMALNVRHIFTVLYLLYHST